MISSPPTQVLSSRPEGRVVCGPQRVLCAPCASPGRRDLLFPSSSVLLGLPFVAAAFGGGRLSPVAQTLMSVLLGSPAFSVLLLSFLCDLCVPSSVIGACPDPVGVLPSLFSSLRSLRKSFPFSCAVSFNFQPSTFDFHLSTPERQLP